MIPPGEGPLPFERLGRTVKPSRTLFFAEFRKADELVATLTFPTKHFVAMLAWDSTNEDVTSISRVAELLIRAGCAYVVAWGEGCERVHDIVDEDLVELELGLDPSRPEAMPMPGPNPFAAYPHVMTSWHADEPLDEVLDFFLGDTFPVDEFELTCGSAVVIAIGQPRDVIRQIRSRLSDPEA